MTISKKVTLQRRPLGKPRAEDFKIVEVELPSVKKGEVLLKTLFFSMDPYMRGRMNDVVSYAPSLSLGDTIIGHGICQVEESKHPDLKEGDIVLATPGWQTHMIIKPKVMSSITRDPNEVYKLPKDVKPSLFLGILGMPGLTAYHGLFKIGEPKKGETVVVAAATGPVGSMVGQLAKNAGCRVVGITGGQDKCRFVVDTLGFDACVDHNSKHFAKELAGACPKGIDVYFENVGGPVLTAVMPLLNTFARMPVCGAVAWYNDFGTLREKGFSVGQIFSRIAAFWRLLVRMDQLPIFIGSTLGKRIKTQGFIIADHMDEYDEFLKKALPLVKTGKIKYKEYIVKGIDNSIEAFNAMLEGKSFGKTIVEI